MSISLSLIAGAGWQFFDNNGNPLSGGLLYTYLAGSTTPQTTYTTSAGNVPHSNPIVLDAAGRVPNEVWVTNGISYKFLLADSTNNTIWTKDDITAPYAGNIFYNQGSSGAVDRTLTNKLQDVVSVKDFGAVGNGVSNDTTAFVNALAAANQVTVPAGTYVLNNLTIAAGECLVMDRGGLLSINGGNTLTISGTLEAGLYQIFDGAGSVVIDPGAVEYVIPQWWGASPSASASVNTSAINKSLACFKVQSNNVYDASWKLPQGLYNINDLLQFPKSGVVEVQRANLIFEGFLQQTDNTKGGIRFSNGNANDGIYYSSIKGIRLYGDTIAQHYASNGAGVQFNGNTANCEIDIPLVYGGFKYGVAFSPNGVGSSAWNKINMGVCRGPQYGFYVRSDGSVGNYFNANNIYGGDYACPFLAAANGAGFTVYGIYGTDYAYSNAYYSPAFAILNYDIKWNRQIGFTVVAPYFDTPTGSEVAADLTACSQGTWIHGYSTFDELDFIYSSDTRAINFLNTGSYSGGNEYTSEFGNAIAFATPVSSPSNNNRVQNIISNVPSQSRSYISNEWLGMDSYLNKGYEGNASAPTSGTYYEGAIVWNTSAIAGSSPIGYMCKTYGTAGTLSGVTGDITINTAILTVNDATNIKYGQNITIAGVSGTKLVVGKNGNQITLASNANATVTGAAVSYYAPTWQALPNF